MKDEPLYDYPVSRSFREYEAEVNEGISLPHIDPPETDAVPVLSDYLKDKIAQLDAMDNQWQQEKAKWRLLENRLNEHLDKSKRKKTALPRGIVPL